MNSVGIPVWRSRLEELLEDPRRRRELTIAGLIAAFTVVVGRSISANYGMVLLGITAAAMLILMIGNQERALHFVLWFSTVYFLLKATLFAWSEGAFLVKEGFFAMLFGLWCFRILLRGEKLRPTPLGRPLLMLVLWLLVQCFNPNTYGILSILQDLRFWLVPIGIFVLTVHLVDTRDKIERALRFVFGYALIETLYGILQQFLPGDTLVALGANPESYFYFSYGTIRSFSTMGTVSFAILAGMFPPIAFFYMSQQKHNGLKRAFFLLSGFAFVIGVILTLVRVGWVATALSIVAYSLVTRRWKVLAILSLSAFVLFASAEGLTRWKLDGLLNPSEDASFQTRLKIHQIVTEAIIFRVFGYGLGTFAHNRFGVGEVDRTGYGTATESWYLMTSLEVGWVGVAILLWIWYRIYRYAWWAWRGGLRTERYRELAIALAASLFSIEVARLGGPSGYFPPDSWHYWFFAALLMNLKQADAELAEEELALAAPARRGEAVLPTAAV